MTCRRKGQQLSELNCGKPDSTEYPCWDPKQGACFNLEGDTRLFSPIHSINRAGQHAWIGASKAYAKALGLDPNSPERRKKLEKEAKKISLTSLGAKVSWPGTYSNPTAPAGRMGTALWAAHGAYPEVMARQAKAVKEPVMREFRRLEHVGETPAPLETVPSFAAAARGNRARVEAAAAARRPKGWWERHGVKITPKVKWGGRRRRRKSRRRKSRRRGRRLRQSRRRGRRLRQSRRRKSRGRRRRQRRRTTRYKGARR